MTWTLTARTLTARTLTALSALLVLAATPAAAQNAPAHPLDVLEAVFTTSDRGPQRLVAKPSQRDYAQALTAMRKAYGKAPNGRGTALVWEIGNPSPGLDQAKTMTVMFEQDGPNRLVIFEDRAPRGRGLAPAATTRLSPRAASPASRSKTPLPSVPITVLTTPQPDE